MLKKFQSEVGKLSFRWLKMIKNIRKMIKIARGFMVCCWTLGLGHVTKSMNFAVSVPGLICLWGSLLG